MAAGGPYGFGGLGAYAHASVTLRQTLSLTSDDETATLELLVARMSHCRGWVRQTVPAAANPAMVRLQFSVGGQVNNVDEWLDFESNVMLAPNIPRIGSFDFPAVKIRYVCTRAAGVATTLEIALGAFA